MSWQILACLAMEDHVDESRDEPLSLIKGDTQYSHLYSMPREMLVLIMQELDTDSLKQMELVCWRFKQISKSHDAFIWRHHLPKSPLDFYPTLDLKRSPFLFTNWKSVVLFWPTLTQFIRDKVEVETSIQPSNPLSSFLYNVFFSINSSSKKEVLNPLQILKSFIPGGEELGEKDEDVRLCLNHYSPNLLDIYNQYEFFFEDVTPVKDSLVIAPYEGGDNHYRIGCQNKFLVSFLDSFWNSFPKKSAKSLISIINYYLWPEKGMKKPQRGVSEFRRYVKQILNHDGRKYGVQDKRLLQLDWWELIVLWYGIGEHSYAQSEIARIRKIEELCLAGNKQAPLFLANYWVRKQQKDPLIALYKQTQSPFYIAGLDMLLTQQTDLLDKDKRLQLALGGSLRAQSMILSLITNKDIEEQLRDAFTVLNFLRKGAPIL